MAGAHPDRRTSAVVNAWVVVLLAVVPILGSMDTAGVEATESGPWGCRTCRIPAPPPAQELPSAWRLPA